MRGADGSDSDKRWHRSWNGQNNSPMREFGRTGGRQAGKILDGASRREHHGAVSQSSSQSVPQQQQPGFTVLGAGRVGKGNGAGKEIAVSGKTRVARLPQSALFRCMRLARALGIPHRAVSVDLSGIPGELAAEPAASLLIAALWVFSPDESRGS